MVWSIMCDGEVRLDSQSLLSVHYHTLNCLSDSFGLGAIEHHDVGQDRLLYVSFYVLLFRIADAACRR